MLSSDWPMLLRPCPYACPKPTSHLPAAAQHVAKGSFNRNFQQGQMKSFFELIVSDDSLNFSTPQKASAAATECPFMPRPSAACRRELGEQLCAMRSDKGHANLPKYSILPLLNRRKPGLFQTRFCSKGSCVLLAQVWVYGELFV